MAPRASSSQFVIVVSAFAALGGLLFGYDTAAISGAVIFIKKDLALSAFPQELVVSMVLVGAAAAAVFGGRLSDSVGRRTTLFVTSLVYVAGALVCGLARSLDELLVGRLVVGIGIGLSTATVPVYISEIAPPHTRGRQVSLFQLAITLGILGAYLVDYAFAESGGWRWMLGLAVIPGALLGLGMFIMPESPRWLVRQGDREKAREILLKIRGGSDIEQEFHEIESAVTESSHKAHWSSLVSPEVRPALIVGIGLAIFQQVTGINTVIYYAPTLLQATGISSASGAILATAGIGVVNVIMTLVSMWLVDRAGRRFLLLTGTAGMIVMLGWLGIIFAAPGSQPTWAPVAVLMAYVACFAISLGPIFWLLIAEIYPLKVRGAAEGVAAASNWAANLLVSLTFLSLLESLGPTRTFWMYGLLAIVSWIFSYFVVPETRGRTLEEIEKSWRFGRRSGTHTENIAHPA